MMNNRHTKELWKDKDADKNERIEMMENEERMDDARTDDSVDNVRIDTMRIDDNKMGSTQMNNSVGEKVSVSENISVGEYV